MINETKKIVKTIQDYHNNKYKQNLKLAYEIVSNFSGNRLILYMENGYCFDVINF